MNVVRSPIRDTTPRWALLDLGEGLLHHPRSSPRYHRRAMSRRRPRDTPDQLDLPAPKPAPTPKSRAPVIQDPAELAKVVVRKSYKESASGRLRVPITVFLERAVIERLHERAI